MEKRGSGESRRGSPVRIKTESPDGHTLVSSAIKRLCSAKTRTSFRLTIQGRFYRSACTHPSWLKELAYQHHRDGGMAVTLPLGRAGGARPSPENTLRHKGFWINQKCGDSGLPPADIMALMGSARQSFGEPVNNKLKVT